MAFRFEQGQINHSLFLVLSFYRLFTFNLGTFGLVLLYLQPLCCNFLLVPPDRRIIRVDGDKALEGDAEFHVSPPSLAIRNLTSRSNFWAASRRLSIGIRRRGLLEKDGGSIGIAIGQEARIDAIDGAD